MKHRHCRVRYHMCLWSAILLSALSLLMSMRVHAYQPPEASDLPLELVGTSGGWARDILVQSNDVYVCAGHRVLLFDASNPHCPTLVSKLPWTYYRPQGLALAENTLYVGLDRELRAYDVSDRRHPEQIGRLWIPMSAGNVEDIIIDGALAYLAIRGDGLCIVDIQNPTPCIVARLDTPWLPCRVQKSGDSLFLGGPRGLAIVDVSEPESPEIRGTWAARYGIQDMALDGDLVYLAEGEAGISVVDVSDRSRPVLVGECATWSWRSWMQHIEVIGDTAWVLDCGNEQIVAFDISNPSSPAPLVERPMPICGQRMAIQNSVAYVVGKNGCLRIVSLEGIDPPEPIGSIAVNESCQGLEVVGTTAYLFSTLPSALHAIDLSAPERPEIVGEYTFGDWFWSSMAWHENRLYLFDNAPGSDPQSLHILDLTTPERIVELGSLELPIHETYPWLVSGAAYHADRVYAAAPESSLYVIDVTNASSPALAATIDTPCQARVLGVLSDALYVAYHPGDDQPSESGLAVFDLSEPDCPTLATLLEMPEPNSLTTYGCTALVSTDTWDTAPHGYSGHYVLDIASPLQPRLVDVWWHDMRQVLECGGRLLVLENTNQFDYWGLGLSIYHPQAPWAIPRGTLATTIHRFAPGVSIGNIALVGSDLALLTNSKLRIYDPDDLERMLELGQYDEPSWVSGVALSGSTVYVSDHEVGLRVLDVTDSDQPEEVGSYIIGGSFWEGNEGIAVTGDLALLASVGNRHGQVGLHVVDVAVPTHPRLESFVQLASYPYRVSAQDDFAFVCHWHGGLDIIDLSDPADAHIVQQIDGQDIKWATAKGDYLYVIDVDGMDVYEIVDPTNPLKCGEFPGIDYIRVRGESGYAVVEDESLVVLDVSTLPRPRVLGTWDAQSEGYSPTRVEVLGDICYVTSRGRHDGIAIVDVSDPSKPELADFCTTTFTSHDLAAEEGLLCTASAQDGIMLFRPYDSTPPAPTPAPTLPAPRWEANLPMILHTN